jgi:DNA topoisomerase-1
MSNATFEKYRMSPEGDGQAGIGSAAHPEFSARLAGLRYVSDEEPGFRRRRHGRGFVLLDPEGNRVRDPSLRARVAELVIPAAWTDVWICEDPEGHLQVTGRDEKGRKQYIYHPEWERVRNETKFNRMVSFGEALPQLRARAEHDLRLKGLSRDKVLATVLTLLDRTLIRIGNDAYAKENQSYGLTTLRDKHVQITGESCTFSFKGKSGKKHTIQLDDERLARIVRSCRDVPGYELFQYYESDGTRRTIGSSDVNAYIKETTGRDLTAKDFRTWGGTVRAARFLCEIGLPDSEKDLKRNLVAMVKRVSAELGNTTTVCRQYYIHPALVSAYENGTFLQLWRDCEKQAPTPGLDETESPLLHFLRSQGPAEIDQPCR